MNLITKMSGALGRKAVVLLRQLTNFYYLCRDALYWMFIAPFKGKSFSWQNAAVQMVRVGVTSIPIVTIITFFVGLIIAMQSAYQLARFGALIYVADLVAVSITRELGPLITAIIITGRNGSAIAAEIGTMKVSEEIDALQTMGINPIRFLVVPRLLAMAIMVPCLTLIADLMGIMGGFVLGVGSLGLDFTRFFIQTTNALIFKDLLTGLIKSFFFALIIGGIGCYQGFIVKGGAEGVGKATTQAVVTSIFLIILADMIFTALFFSTF
ncbi:ABC transporter permease [candidate division KSB1 bacterium]|nr:ABC transporter permease [candidate division KSB1 bacterium]